MTLRFLVEADGGVPMSRDKILQGIWTRLCSVTERSPEALSDEIWKRLAWRDQLVEATINNSTHTGQIAAFGENGELVLRSGEYQVAGAGRSDRLEGGFRHRGGSTCAQVEMQIR